MFEMEIVYKHSMVVVHLGKEASRLRRQKVAAKDKTIAHTAKKQEHVSTESRSSLAWEARGS